MKTATTTAPKYDVDGCRLTDCCGAHSTYCDDGVLCCKACYGEVPIGQGDGSERRPASDALDVRTICDVLPDGMTFDQSGAWLRAFCDENNALYYARPLETFLMAEAITLARAAGKSMLIVEDLS